MVITIWTITFIALCISAIKDLKRTIVAIKFGITALKNLTSGILGMIGMVGLILALIPPENIKLVFTYKGPIGLVIVALIGAIVTIPGPIAFPLAGSMLKIGASYATIASFITTLTMVGIVTAPLEASYFGKKFTFLRQTLSFVAAVIIGLIMGAII